jgi:hypothetical protein
MSQKRFHLKVKPVVDRILLFKDDKFISEMDEVIDETVDEKIFNGFIDTVVSDVPLRNEIDAIFICYCLGEDFMEARAVFSMPFQTQPDDITGDYAPNSICVNYYLPTSDETYKSDGVVSDSTRIAPAKICLVDIPDRLQIGLGLPSVIIVPIALLSDGMKARGAEELKKRGIDIRANGFFFKQIVHLWAKSDADAADYSDEKIKIGLFAHSIHKKIEIEI